MMSFKMLMAPTIIALALSIGGCGSNEKKAEPVTDVAVTDLGAAAETIELNGDSDSGKAGGLRTVYFDYNSATLTGATKSTLDANIEYLKANDKVELQVEGHCDERGGVQYNLALGMKRAKTVQDYMVTMGITKARFAKPISFGKDRPIAFGHEEDSWSQNRRGNFVITAK
ncbi:MAG: hypothetical protein A2504_07265 [Bdellovibrionales bacterium RIFOXYD12_FULL_39_22]|nr:MAG: hypothetical protein A2385_16635 [Bdellovibrionales bacterium RIFOXYB1_FULL_39_21]OFZ44677.1 MAG: hypothetical protein A2485_14495 [Bdellovibrionales bacterium RIFOXYC12_FULL_39_17]OFZ49307.1 MAG: hypothetical protein A2404_08790 [Bdellovibrionales bacterium RIFOXYC1_FULL_39_130]OFZ72592.1 MAG: hypothetical protein A2451_00730 [Bdellovibrionales bacterium RIFOXYC2_FULL_39_8]OFZ77043.1 MAG: hypothetical protein A2560_09755 [Bdellovibrionales bacterium RIFOXYD1_FULL_39_84]OFZ95303.1 MAG: